MACSFGGLPCNQPIDSTIWHAQNNTFINVENAINLKYLSLFFVFISHFSLYKTTVAIEAGEKEGEEEVEDNN